MQVWIPFESSRGCWYGAKSQCTFCGLHEIMQFRERTRPIQLLSELNFTHWQPERYGEKHFFAVDLIMPRSYFKQLLPQLESMNSGWQIFYEVKA